MKIKYTKPQIILELVTAAILTALWLYVILSWGSLPDKIPAHYNVMGVVDRWGNKGEILLLPIISTIFYILLTVISLFPSIWNVPVREQTSEKGKRDSYRHTRNLLILTKLELLAIFCYIAFADTVMQSMSVWFLPVILIVILGTILYFIRKITRAAKH